MTARFQPVMKLKYIQLARSEIDNFSQLIRPRDRQESKVESFQGARVIRNNTEYREGI